MVTRERTAATTPGRRSTARKRHIAVNTGGLLLAVLVTAASYRTASARPLLWN